MKKYDGLFRGGPNLAKFGLSGTIFRKTRGHKMWDNDGCIYVMKAVNDPEIGGVEFEVLMTSRGEIPDEWHYVTVNFDDLERIPEDEVAIIEVMLM